MHQAAQLRKGPTQRQPAVMVGPDRGPDRTWEHRSAFELTIDQQPPDWTCRETVRNHPNSSLTRARLHEPHINGRSPRSERHGLESSGLYRFGSHTSPVPYRSEYCMGHWLEHEDDRLLAAFANATQRQTIRECSCSSTGAHVTTYAYACQRENNLPDLAFVGQVLDTDDLVPHGINLTELDETTAFHETRKQQEKVLKQRQGSSSGASSSNHTREVTDSSSSLGVRRCGRHTNEWLFGNKGIRKTVTDILRG